MQKWVLILLFILPIQFVNGQTFEAIYGDTESDVGRAAIFTSDGGTLILGNTESFGIGSDDDLYVIKTNASGSIQWQKSYSSIGPQSGRAALELTSGDYIIAAYNAHTTRKVNILKLDVNGTIIWNKEFDNGGTYQDIFGIFENPQGLILGGCNSVPGRGGETWLIQLDINGNLISNSTMGEWNTNEYALGMDVSSTSYILTGNGAHHSMWNDDIYIVQDIGLGPTGWTYGNGTATGNDEGHDVALTIDGGSIVTGYTDSWGAGQKDVFLMKLDANCNVQWMKVFGGVNDDQGKFVEQTSDGNYVFGGTTESFGYGGSDFFLCKVDAVGNVLWTFAYGDSGDNIMYSGETNNLDNFLLIGTTEQTPPIFGVKDIYSVCADANGETSGCEMSFTFSESLITPIKTPWGIEQNHITTQTPSYSEVIRNGEDSIKCNSLLDTIIICNGDSVYLYNNWETVTGNYTNGINITTLIVNPTPTITGNFILNGNATQPIPNTYQLTQATNGQSGSTWNSVTLNLTQPFSFDVDMFFGYNNGGADGIAFLLQQVSTIVGTSGGGIGYQGISPSFCVEFDTWQNGSLNSDPWYDHLAVQQNGDLNHSGANNLVPYIGFPPGNINIEDGQWHNVVFSWDPSTFNFKVIFDGTTLVNYNNNIVANIFGNNPYVYWGFTAATGGANNLQQFRVNSLGVQLPDILICHYDTIQIDPQINTSLYSYHWAPNYNISNDTVISPFFSPDTTTTYYLEIENSYGCSNIDSFTLFVDTTNVIILNTTPSLCIGDNPINLNFAAPIGGTYTGVGIVNNIFTPDVNTIGTNIISYHYISSSGCSDSTSQNISVGMPTSSLMSLTACDMYTWPISGLSYSVSGTYIDSSINTSGCLHADTLLLVINYSTTNTTIAKVCDTTYIWPINGQTYTSSGTFLVTSTNSSGCTHTEVLDLAVGHSAEINLLIDENNISCFGYNDGTIILNPNGGTSPYQYLWGNGSINQSLSSLFAGTYSFTIIDDNGCTIDSVATVNEPNQIFLNFIATSPICRYDESVLSIHISNSTSNIYTVSLQDSILKSFVIDTNGLLIPEGVPIILTPNYSGEVYIISLTDNNGCVGIFNDNVHIEVKQLPDLLLNEEDICLGQPSYTLNQATPTGGTYFINDEMTNYFDVENLETGGYKIGYKYTDPITSCYNEIEEIITINESPKAGLLLSPQPTDINNSNIYFRDNSNDLLTSVWDLGDGTIIYDELSFWHTYNNAGTYIIKYYITNQYNCTDSIVENLVINPIYNTYIPLAFTPNDDNDNDYFYPSIIGGNHYNMKIYDRWGGVIYNEDNRKWDGTMNDNSIVSGLYSYSITVFDFKNKPFIYTGLVTLLK